MSFFDFLNQAYPHSPEWIKSLIIAMPPTFVLLLILGLLSIAARFILSWRALSLSRDEIRHAETLKYAPGQKQQPLRPPYLAPDNDPNFPLAKPEDYAPFNEPYPQEKEEHKSKLGGEQEGKQNEEREKEMEKSIEPD